MLAIQTGQTIGFLHEVGQANFVHHAERATQVSWEANAQDRADVAVRRRSQSAALHRARRVQSLRVQNAVFHILHGRLRSRRFGWEEFLQTGPQTFALRRPVVEAFADFFAHAFQVEQFLQRGHGNRGNKIIVLARFVSSGTHGQIDGQLVHDGQRPDGHARLLGCIFQQRGAHAFVQHAHGFVDERADQTRGVEVRHIVDDNRRFLDLGHKVEGLRQCRIGGLFATNDFDQRHAISRAEEVQTNETLGAAAGFGQLADRNA